MAYAEDEPEEEQPRNRLMFPGFLESRFTFQVNFGSQALLVGPTWLRFLAFGTASCMALERGWSQELFTIWLSQEIQWNWPLPHMAWSLLVRSLQKVKGSTIELLAQVTTFNVATIIGRMSLRWRRSATPSPELPSLKALLLTRSGGRKPTCRFLRKGRRIRRDLYHLWYHQRLWDCRTHLHSESEFIALLTIHSDTSFRSMDHSNHASGAIWIHINLLVNCEIGRRTWQK